MYSLSSYLKKSASLSRDNLLVLHQKDFLVEFNGKLVPLSLNIKKSDGNILFFEYSWDLESVGLNALDHYFSIEEDDGKTELFKFQSEKKGFFIYKPKNKNIKIKHATNWFGEINWKTLDIIL
jgi:hypothetical protein